MAGHRSSPRDGYRCITRSALFVGPSATARTRKTRLSLLAPCLQAYRSHRRGTRFDARGDGALFLPAHARSGASNHREVYPSILLVSLSLILVLRWARHPRRHGSQSSSPSALSASVTTSMILLAPAFALFLFASAPGRWRTMLSPQVALAAGARAGALRISAGALWRGLRPPASLASAFQFSGSASLKSLARHHGASRSAVMIGERLRVRSISVSSSARSLRFIAIRCRYVYADAKTAAFCSRLRRDTRLRRQVTSAIPIYSLPSHLMLAIAIAPGLILIGRAVPVRGDCRRSNRSGADRIYSDYPALDRSGDQRPTPFELDAGLDDRQTVLLTDLNWQVENGLNHFAYVMKPDVLYTRLANVILYAPALIRDNAAIGRTTVATDRARLSLQSAYGPLLAATRDDRLPTGGLVDLVRDLPAGTRYVLCLLRPSREFPLDGEDLQAGLRIVTGDRLREMGAGDYSVVAGLVGTEPTLTRSAQLPFRATVSLDGVPVDVRMESWLAFDTIRRMGFAQVTAAHRHVLIVERGVSFVALDGRGIVIRSGYAAGIFAPQPRYLISMK